MLFHHRYDRTDADLDRLGRRFADAGPAVLLATECSTLDV